MGFIWSVILIGQGYISQLYVLHLNAIYIRWINISMFWFAFSMVWIKCGLCSMIPWKSPVAWIYVDFEPKNVPCVHWSPDPGDKALKMWQLLQAFLHILRWNFWVRIICGFIWLLLNILQIAWLNILSWPQNLQSSDSSVIWHCLTKHWTLHRTKCGFCSQH